MMRLRGNFFILGCCLYLASLPLRAGAEASVPLLPLASSYTGGDPKHLSYDPRVDLSLDTHYFSVSGFAFARNDDTQSFHMAPLDANNQMGISSLILYDAGLDLRLSRRHHLAVGYFWGQTQGAGTFSGATGFNDNYYPASGNTDGKIALDSLRLGWYYRALDRDLYPRHLKLDLGAGLLQLRSYVSFEVDQLARNRTGTEAIYAPLVPYLSARSEWQVSRRLQLGMNLQGSFFNIPLDLGYSVSDVPLLTDMPAAAHFYKAALFGEYDLTRYWSVQTGMEYWDWSVRFTGLEDDGNWADNQLALQMVGGYFGMNLHDPHRAALNAWRRLFR